MSLPDDIWIIIRNLLCDDWLSVACALIALPDFRRIVGRWPKPRPCIKLAHDKQSRNRLAQYQWAYVHGVLFVESMNRILKCVIATSDVASMRWIVVSLRAHRQMYSHLEEAIGRVGNLPMIEFIHSQPWFSDWMAGNLLRGAFKGGHAEAIDWLTMRHPGQFWYCQSLVEGLIHGHVDMVDSILHSGKWPGSRNDLNCHALNELVQRGRVDILERLDPSWFEGTNIVAIIQNNLDSLVTKAMEVDAFLPVLSWLERLNFPPLDPRLAMQWALRSKNLSSMQKAYARLPNRDPSDGPRYITELLNGVIDVKCIAWAASLHSDRPLHLDSNMERKQIILACLANSIPLNSEAVAPMLVADKNVTWDELRHLRAHHPDLFFEFCIQAEQDRRQTVI